MQQQAVEYNFAENDSWIILSAIEQSIKRKIEAVGTPLKDWDIRINYGIKTGFNEAFVITTDKRNEILANCQTEDERTRTAELIRPILRGRDIKRYSYDWANLWLINTHNGIKGKIPRIQIENYPAIKAHLDQYWEKISTRADKGDTPYNLRNCAYMEDFSKPKIVWGEISDKSKFAFDFLGEYIPEATSFYMKGECIEYLLSALNSSVSEWLFSKVGTTTGVGTIRWKKYTIEQLIVAKLSTEQLNTHLAAFNDLKVGKMSITDFECFSNKLMYDVYKLTSDEIQYIENHLVEDITVKDVAKYVHISEFYFQKGFAMLCGFTISEYIRKRRLSLAGNEIAGSDIKIIDIAIKYGYDSPDSFTKAFTRFHGVTPTVARKKHTTLKSFAPLKLTIALEGGYLMDYKIERKKAFKVITNEKTFAYENAKKVIPDFWKEHYQTGKGKVVRGVYGINIDKQMGQEKFDYLIADPYQEQVIPEGFVLETIPEFEWAVFPCVGAMPRALQDANVKIFTEWLSALKDYEFAAGYCVEYYDDPTKYLKGTLDENYYCEIWIPIKKR